MGTEIQMLNQMLDRSIDNVLMAIAPQLQPFSGIVKQKVHGFADGYINMFLESDGTVDVDTACDFAKSEMADKIEAFKKKSKEGGK